MPTTQQSNKEVRALVAKELRVNKTEGKAAKIEGYAAIFGSLSEDLGGFREMIAPGAFTRTLAAGADVRMLFNHDTNFLLGRTKSNTLRLREDDVGLFFSCDLPDTQYARDMVEVMSRSDLDQCSFGFYVPENGDDWEMKGGQMIRTLKEVDLDGGDASVCTVPAYRNTSVSLRAKQEVEVRTAGAKEAAAKAATDALSHSDQAAAAAQKQMEVETAAALDTLRVRRQA